MIFPNYPNTTRPVRTLDRVRVLKPPKYPKLQKYIGATGVVLEGMGVGCVWISMDALDLGAGIFEIADLEFIDTERERMAARLGV